jgi:hypothetical protein
MFMYLVPVIGGIVSWLLLGEHFGPLKVVGAFVVLAGLALTRLVASVPAKTSSSLTTSSGMGSLRRAVRTSDDPQPL